MNTTIAVAISGGVDSLMAAHLLLQKGHRVVGLHFRTGYEERPPDVEAIAAQLGIEIHQVDFRSDFSTAVVDYFIRTYKDGKTPNPCLVCNPVIKFGRLMKTALKLGADKLATGHYVRLRRDSDATTHLLRGVDAVKDQSYFLAMLDQHQLSRASFPLGNYRKTEVIAMAAARGFKPATTSESQDACFVAGKTYGDFIEQHDESLSTAGDIVDQQGTVLGRHRGLHRYTVGQRRGLDCPAAQPYYVLEIDTRNNRLVVGFKNETMSRHCRVGQVNWIQPDQQLPMRADTRLRYRHQAAPSQIRLRRDGDIDVRFDEPQSAITPGQGAVFYRQDEVIGGGFIR